jgi:CRP/FNR family cyclic AMP-dependent transcriptional regulator
MTNNQDQSATKSGIRTLGPGEVLFEDGELADSLYIIQKGQVRLYKPKGKGYIELAVLRVGEVIGEMAYFDEDGSGRKRSCSAAAITPVEIIEISFIAFGKTMQSLNPWFKTIINTLVSRLRKTNFRVKELEDNQTSVNYGSKPGNYEFTKPIEVMRVLGTLFLVFKAHGELKNQSLAITRKTLSLYTQDMYRIPESKVESIINILIDLGLAEIHKDDENLPNILLIKNIEVLRQIFIYYTGERHLPDDKKMKVGEKCEQLISQMIQNAQSIPLVDIPNLKVIDGVLPKFTKYYNLSLLITDLKRSQISNITDLVEEGKNIGLFGEVVTMDGQVMVEVDLPKIQKLFAVIRFMNLVKKLNAEKSHSDSYIPVGR